MLGRSGANRSGYLDSHQFPKDRSAHKGGVVPNSRDRGHCPLAPAVGLVEYPFATIFTDALSSPSQAHHLLRCALRTLDGLGYLVLQRFRLYAEEGLAGTEVAVWLQEDSLTVEHGGEALSRYEVECDPVAGAGPVGRLRRVKGHALFETSVVLAQRRLFDLGEVLGEEGWIKFLKLDEYAPRRPRRPDKLQQSLFPYTEAV